MADPNAPSWLSQESPAAAPAAPAPVAAAPAAAATAASTNGAGADADEAELPGVILTMRLANMAVVAALIVVSVC